MDISFDMIMSLMLISAMGFLAVLIFKEKQDTRLNMSMFFSGLWVAVSLFMIDAWCVHLGFWIYPEGNMPVTIFFLWLVVWGIVTVYYSKGRFIAIIVLGLFLIDLGLIPMMEYAKLIQLDDNWLKGEVMVLVLVALPALLWAKAYYEEKWLAFRNAMQVICFGIIMVYAVPSIVDEYFRLEIMDSRRFWPSYLGFIFGIVLPISMPAFLAILELRDKGKGTAFPLDPTKKLVRNGIYAYLRNPIQLSTLLVALAFMSFFQHWTMIVLAAATILYSVGFAETVEKKHMGDRFSDDYRVYRKRVRPWWAHWRPRGIAEATIYFKLHCSFCQKLRKWLERKKTMSLTFVHAEEFPGERLTELTYVDQDGNSYGGIRALAHSLGHVHFLWAFIGWMLRLPGIVHLLQMILDWMDLDNSDLCELPTD